MKRKNLLHDLLSSQVLLEKVPSSTISNKKRICLEKKSDLYACKICFNWNSHQNVSMEKRHFSDNEKDSLRQIFENCEPFQSDAFVGICAKCEQLLIEYRKLKRRLDEIAICIRTVHKLQNIAVDIKNDPEPTLEPSETKYYAVFAPRNLKHSFPVDTESEVISSVKPCSKSSSENPTETKYYEIFAPKRISCGNGKESDLLDDAQDKNATNPEQVVNEVIRSRCLPENKTMELRMPEKIKYELNLKDERDEDETLDDQVVNLDLNENLETAAELLKTDFEICVEEQTESQLTSISLPAGQIDNSPNSTISLESTNQNFSPPQNKIVPLKRKLALKPRPKISAKYSCEKCGRRFCYSTNKNRHLKNNSCSKPSHKHIGILKPKTIVAEQNQKELIKIVENSEKRPQRASKLAAEKRLSSIFKEKSSDQLVDVVESENDEWEESESDESRNESSINDEIDYPKIINEGENCNPISNIQETTNFRCHFDSCNVQFPTLERLRVHVKKHFQALKRKRLRFRRMREKEFGEKRRKECKICQMKFTHPHGHASHRTTNLHYLGIRSRKVDKEGMVSYHCEKPSCPLSFSKLRQLTLHLREHPSESRRNCEACGKSFYRVVSSHYTETVNTCRACLLKVGKGNLMRKCVECDREFTSRSTYLLHIDSLTHKLCLKSRKVDEDGKVTFSCDQMDCNKIFQNFEALQLHHKNHWFYCKHCDEKLENGKAYAAHLWGLGHEEKIQGIDDPNLGAERETYRVFGCALCCKTFPKLAEWRKHIESHDTENILICENCGLSYKTPKSFANHLKTHEEGYKAKPHKKPNFFVPLSEKLFQCLECKRRFTTKARLSVHIKNYHAGIAHTCEICTKNFASKDILAKHKISVHEGKKVKKYKTPKEKCTCRICERTFASAETYQRHLELVHLPVKESCPYKCEEATKFSNVKELKNHLEICKSDKTDGKALCWFCSEIFPNQILRMYHHIKSHETFPCEFCKKSFTKRYVLSYHLSVHKENKPWICEKCGNAFTKEWNLKIHMTNICGNDDESKKALAEKRKEQYKVFREKSQSHKCPNCPKRFVDERRLNEHKRKEHDETEEASETESE